VQVLLLIVATPLAVWVADRWLCRGEFARLVRETVSEERARRAKAATRRPRVST
jgi:hypothetical protein